MDLFKSLASNISGGILRMATGPPPYSVEEVNPQQYTSSKFTVLCKDECVILYKNGSTCEALLYHPPYSPKAFSLFRLMNDGEAMALYSTYCSRLLPLYNSTKKIFNKEMINQLCICIREHRSWTSAHLAAKFGLTACFRNNYITKQLNEICDETHLAPIHIAMQTGDLECVQEIIISGARLDVVDLAGDGVFHYAARTGNKNIVQMLASKDITLINQLNMCGESAMHVACLDDKPDCVEQLLRCGADPSLNMSGRNPIHCAMKASAAKCVESIYKWDPQQLHAQDVQYGGTPLHWAKDAECIYLLSDLGCNLDASNKYGDKPLHIMVKKNRLDCVMALLSKGADGAAVNSSGNNTLHQAIETDNIDLVQALIVFGADINGKNEKGCTPRHAAATSKGTNRDILVYLLHKVGAVRCPQIMSGCNDGCSATGNFDGRSHGKIATPTDPYKQFYDDMVANTAMAAALTRSASASGSAIMMEVTDSCIGGSSGDRILCLDGGGIRGLVLIQILLAIEKQVGKPIRECFDWIGGTSTGGILALALVHGKSVRYGQGLYFRLKDAVFCGRRPYDSKPLEIFMKKEFGENIRMTEKEYPRLLVTGVIADRHPAELHFFRNYDPPLLNNAQKQVDPRFEPCPRPNEQMVWRAARSSGAAPTYFRACGRFLDGGLIANNPTLDVLTEVHEYNMGLKAQGMGHLVRPIHCVVSLGTGRIPVTEVKNCDVYMPGGILDVARVAFGATALGNLLIDQATNSEGRPVDRARAWCSMIDVPFFRLSPQLSEEVPLDCKDNKTLVKMLWETQCYLHENRGKIAQIATVLDS